MNQASSTSAAPAPAHTQTMRWALLSMVAAVVTVVLKFGAYRATNSVGLLSDAVESLANVVAAATALGAIWYSSRPADSDHPYGHEKIEFFSSGVEGALVCGAAFTIVSTALSRLRAPGEIVNLDWGVALALAATLVNFAVARTLLREARRLDSIVLEADGHHLMSDVWTSIVVVAALIAVKLTGWNWLDPVLAILVAVNIARIGFDLLRRSFDGLMDRALQPGEIEAIRQAIENGLGKGETFHALRTRRAGSRRFVDYHLLVPGALAVQAAHDREMEIGRAIEQACPGAEVTTHIEPIEEPLAWNDARVE
jgi:cation diffusion facilitator family transporter